MYMRASGASELRKFSCFHILKLLFLSVFCRYFRYFVGTNDMIILAAYMYRQISICTDKTPKKHYWGGGIPPPPPLAALVYTTCINTILIFLFRMTNDDYI